jgi:hypothetical protein
MDLANDYSKEFPMAYIKQSHFSVLPESFRWLISNKKYTEAEDVIKRIAKINGREPPKACLKKLYDITQKLEKENTTVKIYTLKDIFKDGELLKKSCILWTSWCVYYDVTKTRALRTLTVAHT